MINGDEEVESGERESDAFRLCPMIAVMYYATSNLSAVISIQSLVF